MNAPTSLIEHRVGDRHRMVWMERELALIRKKSVDLCVWRRRRDDRFDTWCQEIARSHPALQIDAPMTLDAVPLDGLLASLPATPERQKLRDDVRARALSFGRVVGCEDLRLQLHVVNQQSCPRFHVDSVGVRLLVTYAGPATEWIAETDLAREALGRGPAAALPVKATGSIQSLERFDVALMKGRSWRRNRCFGVVHRSPTVHEQPRLVLTIDSRP